MRRCDTAVLFNTEPILEHQSVSNRFLMSPKTLALSPTRQNLWRLILIRLLVLLAQSLSVMGAYVSGWFPLPWAPLLLTLGLSALVSIMTLLRLSRRWPVTDFEYGLQLSFDMLVHSVLLYYSGGPTNPFNADDPYNKLSFFFDYGTKTNAAPLVFQALAGDRDGIAQRRAVIAAAAAVDIRLAQLAYDGF